MSLIGVSILYIIDSTSVVHLRSLSLTSNLHKNISLPWNGGNEFYPAQQYPEHKSWRWALLLCDSPHTPEDS